jgi:pyruvate dehydrogenase E1 component alpha subunit
MSERKVVKVLDAKGQAKGYKPDLSDEELLRCYGTMLKVRAFDEIAMKLQRSGRIGFSVPNLGVEGTQVGSASAFKQSDWFFPSYRDFGVAMYHGVDPLRMMNNMFGNADDQARGRQMPVHFSFDDPVKFVSISSPLGTHLPQAVGAAFAAQRRGEDTVVLASFGDGSTSTLGFHSALNFAGVWKSPVVFLCQNNGYAISMPIEAQTASDGIAIKGEAYGIPNVAVDGNDLLAVHKVTAEAVARARSGGGPTLIEAVTFRMGGHSTSDDPSKYVPKKLLDAWAKKDPVPRFEKYLATRKLWTAKLGKQMRSEVEAEVAAAAKTAQMVDKPSLETVFSDVYEEVPAHIRKQGQAAFELAARRGGAEGGGGAFPL